MYRVIKRSNKIPVLNHKTLYYECCEDYISIKPNLKTFSVQDFKQQMYTNIVNNQVNEEDCKCKEQYRNNKQIKSTCIHNLGSLKFRSRFETIYGTPIMGGKSKCFLDLTPYFIDSEPHFAEIQFKDIPSIVNLYYAHSVIWQNFYLNNKDADTTHHHYSGMVVEADYDKMIVTPLISG